MPENVGNPFPCESSRRVFREMKLWLNIVFAFAALTEKRLFYLCLPARKNAR